MSDFWRALALMSGLLLLAALIWPWWVTRDGGVPDAAMMNVDIPLVIAGLGTCIGSLLVMILPWDEV